MYAEIKTKSTLALMWSAFAQLLARAVQPLLMLYLAHLLIPAEYGILEAVTLVIALAQIIQEFGLGKAFIQSDGDLEEKSTGILLVQIALSFIVFGFLFILSPSFSRLLGDIRIIFAIRLSSIQLIIRSFGYIVLARFQRNLEYKKQFVSQFVGMIILVLTTFSLLTFNFGFISFIIGMITGALAEVISLWVQSKWKLTTFRGMNNVSNLARFGLLSTVENLQGWLLNFGDNFIVGAFMGLSSLGTYALAFNIINFSVGALTSPIVSVAYSAFSRLKASFSDLQRSYMSLLELVSMIVLPACFGIFAISIPLVQLLFSKQDWQSLTVVIKILSIFPGLSFIFILNSELYRAIGKPEIMPRILFAALLYSIPAYIIAANFGLIQFAAARFSVGLIFFPVHAVIAYKELNLSKTYLWKVVKFPLLGSTLMSVMCVSLSKLLSPFNGFVGGIKLIFIITFAICFYIGSIYLLNRKSFSKMVLLIKQAINSLSK